MGSTDTPALCTEDGLTSPVSTTTPPSRPDVTTITSAEFYTAKSPSTDAPSTLTTTGEPRPSVPMLPSASTLCATCTSGDHLAYESAHLPLGNSAFTSGTSLLA